MEQESKDTKPPEKRNITVTSNSGDWEVKNEGDSAVLFSSQDKEAAVKFAKSMAETHKVKLHVEGEDDGEPAKKSDIIVIYDKEAWIVRNENDSAVLFSSPDKEPAVDFANQMGKEHKVKVRVE